MGDAETFNPDREFSEAELWHEQPFAAYNPNSKRLSPFTYPPRDCLGKNFAQMEMRTILSYLYRNFSFSLAEPMLSGDYDPSEYVGINYPNRGLPLHATPRHDTLKLS